MIQKPRSLIKSGRILIVALLLFSGITGYGVTVNASTAAQVARIQSQVINYRLANTNTFDVNHTISTHNPTPLLDKEGNQILAYVFDLNPEGFVVVTANTDIVPIITYSPRGSFPWSEDPLNTLLHMLRHDLNLRMEAIEILPQDVIDRNNDQWMQYEEGYVDFLAPGDSWPEDGQTWTGGWIESMWHQGSPYNDLCPIDPVTSDRSVVGCVATAMGQIIFFWRYPDEVTFTSADNYVTDNRGISIDATTASIPNIDYEDSSVDTDLSYACGVSVLMDYSSEGSGANHFDCASGYVGDFAFTNAQWKDSGDADFYDVLEQNMKDSMPAQLGITGAGGHSIVCDGFRETATNDEWHLNYGWGGGNPDPLSQSWYVLPAGLPAGFNTVVDGVVNIESPRRPSNTAVPVADFTGSPTSGAAPLTVTFTDASTGDPTSWEWDFGDSRTSTAQNPTHVYDSDGQYTVRLIVSNADGTDTLTRADYITVGTGNPPTAAFSGNPTSGSVPLTVTFTDESTGDPTGWLWDFGDGNTSTTQSPVHQYTAEGTYDVELIAINANGSDTLLRTGYITVGAAPVPPVADFSGTPTSGAAPLSVTFTDASTGSPTSWNWDFGDGNTSTTQNPVHQYTAQGSYDVRLIVANADGSDTLTRAGYITVGPAPNPPTAAFSANPTRCYVPFTHRAEVTFTDESTGSPTAWAWDFGDGNNSTDQNPTHTFTTVGLFTVRLIAANADGPDTTSDTIRIASMPADFYLPPILANAANNEIEINYAVPHNTGIELLIYNVNGQLVRSLLREEVEIGEHTVIWDMRDEKGLAITPGVYFLELRANKQQAVSKIVIAR